MTEEKKNEFEIENTASIEPANREQFLSVSPQNSIKALEKINAITKVIDGAVRLALQRTVPQDWVLMGKGYYLQASGVEKIRSVFGLYFRNMVIIKEDLADGHYSYICSLVAGSKLLDGLFGSETTIEIEGCRSSNDSFFSNQAATDPMDVRRASYANAQVRAAKALLGFGNYTAEDLAKMGISVGKITKVEYQKGAEGGGKTECISEPQQKRLFAICRSNNIAEAVIKEYLQKNYNINTSKDILRKDYNHIVSWVEAGGVEPPNNLGEQSE